MLYLPEAVGGVAIGTWPVVARFKVFYQCDAIKVTYKTPKRKLKVRRKVRRETTGGSDSGNSSNSPSTDGV